MSTEADSQISTMRCRCSTRDLSMSSVTEKESEPAVEKQEDAVHESETDLDNQVFRGTDTEGRNYASMDEMWKAQGVYSKSTAKESWYNRAAEYYEDNCPATLDGVLGGFAAISDLDLQGSRAILEQLEILRPSLEWSTGAACECGAGIGRVTKGLLLSLGVKRCDLVESSARLLSAAPDYIGDDGSSRCRFYCQGLQEWEPAANTYSIVWIQWVLCYLTDEDAIDFLRRCGESLVENGVVCLKENTCEDEDFVLDVEDASVTRSVPYLLSLIRKAGLRVVLQRTQDDFPDAIFPVEQIALEVPR